LWAILVWRGRLRRDLTDCQRTTVVRDIDSPPRAVTMRVFDLDEREVHSAIKGDSKR